MKSLAKRLLRAIAPKRFAALSSARSNRHGQRVLERHGVPLLARQFVAKYGAQVQSGPFAGMKYLDRAIGSSFLPKLIGSYERELHEIIEKLLPNHYDCVIDVGSAEGYYAIGLAMKLPGHPTVYAFDTDKAAQELCQRLAQINAVSEKVLVSGYCDTDLLQNTIRGRTLLICDCEGYEVQLLDADLVPALSHTEILVELHDTPQTSVAHLLKQRFSASHHIQIVDTAARDAQHYPNLDFLESEQKQIALSEFRNGPQQWAYLVPFATETK